MSTEIKVGQVWRDKDKRRDTVIEIIEVGTGHESGKSLGLVVGTEEERWYSDDRLVKRWMMVYDKNDDETEKVRDEFLKATATHKTREEWLNAAVAELREWIFGEEHPVPDVHVSVGWPGGRGPKANTIGQCWQPDSSADGVGQIFISPVVAEPVHVLATLVHELVHAINHKNGENGHRGPFKRIAEELGLEGKMTATHAGAELAAKLEEIAEGLGFYPHSKISTEDKPKVQKTYMLKYVSPEEPDYFVRITQNKIDEYGAPRDPWGNEMEQEL